MQKNRYEKSETFRAEMFKSLGYFAASFTGLSLLQIVVFGKSIDISYNTVIAFAISLFVTAFFINKSYSIYLKLDENLHRQKEIHERNHRNI